MDIKDYVEIRNKVLAGVDLTSWVWPKDDTGAWEGPFSDWNNHHSNHYFRRLKNFGTIITAGANCGVYVRAYAGMFERVLAFEPHWINFYCLCQNAPYPNVFSYRAALGDKAELLFLTERTQDNMGGHSMVGNGPKNTPTFRIDDISAAFGKIDMIQLDVEAFEYRVLSGAKETLMRDSPIVVAERPNQYTERFLDNLGYHLQSISTGDHIYFKGEN